MLQVDKWEIKMRSYEFVADQLIIESLLTEEFQVAELPEKFGKGFGVFDAEGNLVGEFANEGDAKRFMDQKNAELKTAGGNAGKPKNVAWQKIRKALGFMSNTGFVKLLTLITAWYNWKDIEEVFKGHARWLTQNHCVKGKSFSKENWVREDYETVRKFSTELAKHLTQTVFQILNAFLSGLIAVSRISAILSRFPGTPAWAITIVVWGGTSLAVVAINKLIENPRTYPWFNKFFFNQSQKIFLNDLYNTEVCNEPIDLGASVAELVPDWVPLVNESANPDEYNEESILLSEWKQIWSDIYKDPEVQAAYKQALENKKSGITP